MPSENVFNVLNTNLVSAFSVTGYKYFIKFNKIQIFPIEFTSRLVQANFGEVHLENPPQMTLFYESNNTNIIGS